MYNKVFLVMSHESKGESESGNPNLVCFLQKDRVKGKKLKPKTKNIEGPSTVNHFSSKLINHARMFLHFGNLCFKDAYYFVYTCIPSLPIKI